MESVVNFFEHISPLARTLILAGGLVFFWMLESIVPLFKMTFLRYRHAGLNLVFTFTTIIVNFLFAFFIVKVSDWAVLNNFGLLYLADLPLWLFILLGLMILDLISAYWIHYIQHKVKWMWKFHLVHHTDTWVDTTTANRHHPGESVIRFVFTTLGVLIVGSPMWMVFLYQSLSVIFSQFNHANISLPNKLDLFLSYFIVSPNMHKVHHHYVLPYTDSNYGNIFSVWDRLFGTYTYLPKDQLIYGVDTHMLAEENNQLKNLLQIPFQKTRSAKNTKNQ